MGKVDGGVPTTDAPRSGKLAPRGGYLVVGRTLDDAHRVKVAQFTAGNHVAVEEGGVLTIYAVAPLMDGGNVTNGVDNRGSSAAVRSQQSQSVGDRRVSGPITPDEINQKNRDYWARQNGQGGRR